MGEVGGTNIYEKLMMKEEFSILHSSFFISSCVLLLSYRTKLLKNISSIHKKTLPLHPQTALVAKLVDALDLGSSVLRRAGSSPVRRTNILGVTN